MKRNIQHGKHCSITNERCITVQMFAQAITNTKLKAQQNLQKKKHANVSFVPNAFVKKQWKIITGKIMKRISCGVSVNLAVVNVEKSC